WMTQHNLLEYHKAQRRLLERLLALPLEAVPAMTQLVREDWRQRGLTGRYPELEYACEEVAQLVRVPG
ncbi:MAG: hypothetical protein IRZ24_08120, partial [Thermogemmatispora sp.]